MALCIPRGHYAQNNKFAAELEISPPSVLSFAGCMQKGLMGEDQELQVSFRGRITKSPLKFFFILEQVSLYKQCFKNKQTKKLF